LQHEVTHTSKTEKS